MSKGTYLGIRAAGRRMIDQGSGRIINISSQAGCSGWPLLGAYCAAKFAIDGLTQVAAAELGPHGITVNAICPGTVETPLLEQIPLRRFQRPADVADAAVFLAADGGGYITGEALLSTGGQTMP